MNTAIIRNWNRVVFPEDTIYVLGDVAFGDPKSAVRLIAQLNGTKHLIVGNHDRPKYLISYMQVFDSITYGFKEIKIIEEQSEERLHFTLCHYPMVAWNHSHRGSFHLYGHVHGQYDNPESLSMDVGIDTHPEYRPYSLDEVLTKLYKKSTNPLIKKDGK